MMDVISFVIVIVLKVMSLKHRVRIQSRKNRRKKFHDQFQVVEEALKVRSSSPSFLTKRT